MRPTITFKFDLEKFIAAMSHMASKVNDLTRLRAAKLLYFADKFHLRKYGRPIIGDCYVRIDHGPVPSRSLDLMHELANPFRLRGVARPTMDRLKKFLDVQQGPTHPRFVAKRQPDYSVLSESDLEALDYAVSKFGAVSVARVWNAGHNERSWRETAPNQMIDYRLFFDEDDPKHRELLSLIEESQETESFLDAGLVARD